MKGAFEVPGFHSADKVGIYRQQQPTKFNWDYVTPKINKPPRCFVFGLWCNKRIPNWHFFPGESCSCLVTLSKLIHSRHNLWRPRVLSSRNPRTAHITQEQTQQVQGQRSAPAPPSHSSSLSTLGAKNIKVCLTERKLSLLQSFA